MLSVGVATSICLPFEVMHPRSRAILRFEPLVCFVHFAASLLFSVLFRRSKS